MYVTNRGNPQMPGVSTEKVCLDHKRIEDLL